MCDGNCKECTKRSSGIVVEANPVKTRVTVPAKMVFEKSHEKARYKLAQTFLEGKAMVIGYETAVEIFIPIKAVIDGVKELYVYEIVSQMHAPCQQAIITNKLLDHPDINRLTVLDDMEVLLNLDITKVREVVAGVQKQNFIDGLVKEYKELFLESENRFLEKVKEIIADEEVTSEEINGTEE